MEIVLVLVLAAFVLALTYNKRAHTRWRETLRATADQLGLEYQRGGWPRGSKAQGSLGDVRVAIDTFARRSGKSSRTYTRVRATPPAFPARELRAESLGSSFKKAFVGEDLLTGDRAFDEAVVVRGDESRLVARLDADTRRLVSWAVQSGIRLYDGALYWERAGYVRDAERLVSVVETMLELARRLGGSGGGLRSRDRLVDNAFNDPLQGVRDRNLRLLFEHYADDYTTREAARRVDGRFDPELRLAAARWLGPEAAVALRDLAVADGLPLEPRADALRLLASSHADAPQTAEAVQAPLARHADPLLAVALEIVRELGVDPPIDALLGHVDHPERAARAAVATGLGERDADAARDALLAWLERDEPEVVRLAVIESLGRIGGREAVEPLLPLTRGLLTDGDVKRAARGAVEAIQARLGQGGGGRLSIAEATDAGGLALAEGGGEISLDEPAEAEAEERG